MGRKKYPRPQGHYRAIPGDHVLTADQSDPANIRLRAQWTGSLCYLCWEKGTVIVKGHLYCVKHAPKE